jgi:hypothetical protein
MAEGEPKVFGSSDPETVSRHFGIDAHIVEELNVAAARIESVRRHPAAMGFNAAEDDTALFKGVQLRGEVSGEDL